MVNYTLVSDLNSLSRRFRDSMKGVELATARTPSNLSVEVQAARQAFDIGILYDPRFEYQKVSEGIEEPLLAFAGDLDPTISEWHERMLMAVEDQLETIRALRERSPERMTAISVARNGKPSLETQKRANQLLMESSTPISEAAIQGNERLVSSRDVHDVFLKALTALELTSWKVKLRRGMIARLSVLAFATRGQDARGRRFLTIRSAPTSDP